MKGVIGVLLMFEVSTIAYGMKTIMVDSKDADRKEAKKEVKHHRLSKSIGCPFGFQIVPEMTRECKRSRDDSSVSNDNRILHASRAHQSVSSSHLRNPSMNSLIILQPEDDTELIRRQFFQAVYQNNLEKASKIWAAYNNQNGNQSQLLSAHDCNYDGSYLLHVAVRSPFCGNGAMCSMLHFLVSVVNAAICAVDLRRRTALHYLAYNGDCKEAELLLKNDDDRRSLINAVDDKGNTALHYAALRNKAAMMYLLLQYGAWVMFYNKELPKEPKTPIDIAKEEKCSQEIIQALQKKADEQIKEVAKQSCCCSCLRWFFSQLCSCCCCQ